nr:dna repair protein rhp57 [Quercus suber]
MTNLLTVLPDFDLNPYSHILPSLEKAQIATADLLTLDAVDVAKRAQVPSGEVRKLTEALLAGLHASSSNATADGPTSAFIPGSDLIKRWATISTLDDELDSVLRGGIGAGCLTEFVGESAAGKTQFLLNSVALCATAISTRTWKIGTVHIYGGATPDHQIVTDPSRPP